MYNSTCTMANQAIRILIICVIGPSFLARSTFSSEISDIVSGCSWSVRVVNQHQLHCEPIADVVDQENMLITDQVLTSATNLETRVPELEEEYLTFPYALRVQVQCDGGISYSVARRLAATGTVPKVSILHTYGTLEHVLNGALVDLKQLEFESDVKCNVSDTSGCQEDLCLPAWIVPMPFDNQTQCLSVEVSSDGSGQLVQSQRYTVRISKYIADLGTGHSEGRLELSASDLQEWQVQAPMGDGNSPVVLNGPPTSNTLLFSKDELNTIDILEIELPHSDVAVCESSNEEPAILDSLALQDRVLLGTNVGLLEMREATEHVIVLPVCITKLVSDLQVKKTDPVVIAIEETGQAYAAVIDGDEVATFTELTDANQMTVCSYIAYLTDVDDGNCTMISAAIDPTTSDHYLFLLKISSADDASEYFLAEYSGNTSSAAWSKLSQLSGAKFISLPTDNVSPFGDWRGMSYTAMVSRHLFIWGDGLIQSTDSGKTLYMMTTYPVHPKSAITAFTSSLDGAYAFLNQLQEVWYGYVGDFQNLIKLIPSSSWSLLSTLHQSGSYDSDQYNATTLNVFFDNYQDLYQLVAYYQHANETEVHIDRHPIPVADIISGENYQQREKAAADDITHSGHCPFSKIQYEALSSQYYSRTQKFVYQPPRLSMNEQVYDEDALSVYQGIVYQVLNYHVNNIQVYADAYYDPLQDWRESKMSLQDYHTYLYRNHLSLSPVFVSLDHYYKMYEEDFVASKLPERIYLDRNMSYEITVRVSLGDSENSASAELLENSQLEIDVSDYSLVQVVTQRQSYHINDSVTYQVTIASSGIDTDEGSHRLPRPVTVTLQIWNSALKCTSNTQTGKELQGTKKITVMIGCPAGRQLIFDLQKSIKYLSEVAEVQHDCPIPDPQLPCIYYGNAFYPHFYIQDQVTGRRELFTSNYTFEVIAGGMSQSNMEYFTAGQIERYNSIDMESNSLIWISKNASRLSSRTVFNFSTKAIHWHCQANSPCSDVPLNFPYGPEYYFLVRVSNRHVDSSTYCDYHTQFVLKIHGFRPSFHTSFIIIGVTLGVWVAYLVLYFVCKYKDEKVLKAFKKRVLKQRIHPEDVPPFSRPDSENSSEEEEEEKILHINEPSPSVTFSEHIQSLDAWFPERPASPSSAHTDQGMASVSLHKSILKKRFSTGDPP